MCRNSIKMIASGATMITDFTICLYVISVNYVNSVVKKRILSDHI